MFRSLRSRKLAYLLTGIMCWAGSYAGAARADIVGTEALLTEVNASNLRAELGAALQRQDVLVQLQAHGVDPAQAAERVAALSDQEIQHLAQNFDELPAGGDVVLLLVIIILVLLLR